MAQSAAERKAKSRANKVALGYCKACGTRKPIPPKVTCEHCIAARLGDAKPLPALRRKINVSEARAIIEILEDISSGDSAMDLRYAINKILS